MLCYYSNFALTKLIVFDLILPCGIVGAAIIVTGFYGVIWAQSKEDKDGVIRAQAKEDKDEVANTSTTPLLQRPLLT